MSHIMTQPYIVTFVQLGGGWVVLVEIKDQLGLINKASVDVYFIYS